MKKRGKARADLSLGVKRCDGGGWPESGRATTLIISFSLIYFMACNAA